MIHLNAKALRRRAHEMFKASKQPIDSDSQALLLFYAAECGLKSLYLRYFMLKNTGTRTATIQPASWYNHRLDELIIALKIAERTLQPRPRAIVLRGGDVINVDSLHQVWRYGAVLDPPNLALEWLNSVVEYALRELR